MQNKNFEIMSPVGSYESLTAAIQGGADSVYFGIEKLNMRSRSSKNFKIDDLIKISGICKENAIRSYLTLNTVIYDEEIKLAYEIIDAAKANDISAIIASDMSVIQYARKIGMEVHMSTQCNITNIEAVRYYSQYADVMVMARELNTDQVKNISKTIAKEKICGPSGDLVQIEVFVHGALCMAVSGKCYLSLDNENFSANRGTCLQICRRPYKITDMDGDTELSVENQYIMSPKDLCTISFLDKIVKSGVKVFKIEGRGRSPEYVKKVTECYKEALDAILEDSFSDDKVEKWTAELKSVYNRDFWDGYYLGKKLGEWSDKYGSQATTKKIYVGKINNYFSKLKVAEVKIETNSLNINDDILIIGPTTGVYEDNVKEIRVDLKNVNEAVKGEVCSLPVSDIVRRSDKLYKVVDAEEF